MRTLVSIFLAISAVATPARADWQWTEWGMTPAEVIIASAGTANSHSASAMSNITADHLVTAPYTAMGIGFQAHFLFDRSTGGLAYVYVYAEDDADCPRLRSWIGEIYGEPALSDGRATRIYYDRIESNRVTFVQFLTTRCVITYAELPSRGQGL